MAEETQAFQDFSELEVPGEAGLYWCWRHRKVQTRLRCGRCEKPICPKCTRMGPTGARCVECASNRTQHIYQVGPLHLALTFIASAVLSIIGVAVLQRIGFFLLFFAPFIGTFLGKAITTITRGKRGPVLAGVASAGAVVGASIPLVLKGLWIAQMRSQLPPGTLPPDMGFGIGFLGEIGYVLIYLAIIIPALWYWIK
jgi:hypothetical protein